MMRENALLNDEMTKTDRRSMMEIYYDLWNLMDYMTRKIDEARKVNEANNTYSEANSSRAFQMIQIVSSCKEW